MRQCHRFKNGLIAFEYVDILLQLTKLLEMVTETRMYLKNSFFRKRSVCGS